MNLLSFGLHDATYLVIYLSVCQIWFPLLQKQPIKVATLELLGLFSLAQATIYLIIYTIFCHLFQSQLLYC